MAKVNLSFRERALAEAARYGSDSWVFLRELLQNARDAGAGRVEVLVTEVDDLRRIVCRDDGCGMSAVHAHRYLFALYASSKETDARQAGQFGVGFWSVLRFKPDRVVIRSRQKGSVAWQVELNHRLENAVFTSCEMATGTEIVLERRRSRRAARRRPLEDKVFEAVRHYGRFLTRGGPQLAVGPLEPLEITVNGRTANSELGLPAPSACFRRRGFRGAVALASEPRVEVFASGLFVRQATCLEDLVDEGENGDLGDGESSLDLPGSLAPQVILDSSELEVLLARSDVRQTRLLRRMVRTAEKELERLIERQLEALRPQPWYLPMWNRLRGLGQRLGELRWPWAPSWLVPAVVLGILLGWLVASWSPRDSAGAGWATLEFRNWRDAFSRSASPGSASPDALLGYTDPGREYRGPRMDLPAADRGRIPLDYEPAERELYLTAFVVEDPSSWSPRGIHRPDAAGPYEGRSCSRAADAPDDPCVAIRMVIGESNLRLPVPTGHRLDAASVRVNGDPYPIQATKVGEPLLLGAHPTDVVEYLTGPAPAPDTYRPAPAGEAPPALARLAAELRTLPHEARVDKAVDLVTSLVAYDLSSQTMALHDAEWQMGRGFVEAALAVGKGDCDIQNGVLVALLRAAGVTARLAVGYVGEEGRVAPLLHAWVEYLDARREWHVADAVVNAGTSQLAWLGGPGGDRDALYGSDLYEPVPARGPRAWLSRALSRWTAGYEPGRSAVLAVLFSAVVLGIGSLARRRSEPPGAVELADTDLAALLGGALQHPGLARLPALLHGRFVPLIERSSAGSGRRRAISLHEARRRASSSALYSSAVGSRLARAAAARGFPVIDASLAEGRVASLGLGAIDLDEWSDLLDRGTDSGLLKHLNEYLGSIGEDWRLALTSPLAQPVKVVDLSRLGLGRRQVLIDPRSADFAAIGPRLDLRSDVAAFRLLDAVVDHLDLDRSDRARLLSELARRAVFEEHGR